MGKKYIVEEVESGSGWGCLSVIGLITVVGFVLLLCAAMAK